MTNDERKAAVLDLFHSLSIIVGTCASLDGWQCDQILEQCKRATAAAVKLADDLEGR